MARASRAPSVSVWTPRGEHRRKAFTLHHPHHRPSFYSCIRTVYCMLYRFSAAISYYCYLFTFLLVYIVLILDCVGYFHRPKKPLIQSRYTHISECFLLARLRRRIKHVSTDWFAAQLGLARSSARLASVRPYSGLGSARYVFIRGSTRVFVLSSVWFGSALPRGLAREGLIKSVDL